MEEQVSRKAGGKKIKMIQPIEIPFSQIKETKMIISF